MRLGSSIKIVLVGLLMTVATTVGLIWPGVVSRHAQFVPADRRADVEQPGGADTASDSAFAASPSQSADTLTVAPIRTAASAPTAIPDPFPNAAPLAQSIHLQRPGLQRRIRLVRTDFKYPLIRLDEQVRIDPVSGERLLISQTAAVGDHVIVSLEPGTPAAQLEALVTRADAHIRDRLAFANTYLVAVDTANADTVETLVAFFSGGHPGIRYAEPDVIVARADVTPNDPSYNLQWHLPQIEMPQAWTRGTGSHDVVVAVIDTGIDYNHPDLAGNIWINSGETGNGVDSDGNGYVDDIRGWNFYSPNNNPMDLDSHGTHIAGIIGAVGNNAAGIAGISWHVGLMALRVFDDTGQVASSSDVADAIDYATVMRQNHGVNVQVINASWGMGINNATVANAIANADAAGILFVAAAGNSSSNNDTYPYYPASYPNANIIAVANTTSNDGLAFSSNYGATSVHLGAPGTSIYSTIRNGTYAEKSGTSMAAPMVAGAAALLWSIEPGLSVADVKDAILTSVDPLPTLSGKTVTGGRLNAAGAVAAVTPAITHAPHGNTTETDATTGAYQLGMTVNPDGMVPADGVTIHWSTDGGVTFYASPAVQGGPGQYSGVINAMPLGTRILYRIRAVTDGGWTTWHPGPDAAGLHLFDVKYPEPPVVTPAGQPAQATDGSGYVTWELDVSDPDRRATGLTLNFSTNGVDWVTAPVIAASATTGQPALESGHTPAVTGIDTGGDGFPLTNRVTLTWASRAGTPVTEYPAVLLSARGWDGEFWSEPADGGPFGVDNVPPSPAGAAITFQTSAFGNYVVTTAVHTAWTGFTDAGSGIDHYYVSLTDGGGSVAGSAVDATETLVENLIEDVENMVYVWAVDKAGNIGPAVSAAILALSPDGDYDGNGVFNLDEEIAGTDATDNASTFQLLHEMDTPPAHDIVLRWQSVSNRFYTLRQTESLTLPGDAWPIVPAVSNLPGTGGMMTYTGQTATATARFYRLEVAP